MFARVFESSLFKVLFEEHSLATQIQQIGLLLMYLYSFMTDLKLEAKLEHHLFDEDLSEARLAKRVVLEVESVKAVEGVLVGMHIQGVHIQLVPAIEKVSSTVDETMHKFFTFWLWPEDLLCCLYSSSEIQCSGLHVGIGAYIA